MTAQNTPVRVESTLKQVIDVYRGGILAEPKTGTSHCWYCSPFFFSCSLLAQIISSDADNFYLSEQEGEENFDLSLISSLETDVIPCLGGGRVPDYLITQLAN
jgi:hypothetical protein